MFDTPHDSDLRSYQRLQTRKPARLSIDGSWCDCFILDVSGSGARLEIPDPPPVGQGVVLIDEDLGMIAGTIRRRGDGEASVEFGVSDEAKKELAEKLASSLSNSFLS